MLHIRVSLTQKFSVKRIFMGKINKAKVLNKCGQIFHQCGAMISQETKCFIICPPKVTCCVSQERITD